jgi:chromosome segregation ATPase
LRSAAQDSSLQDAEIERLRNLVEEGSMKQNNLTRGLQARAHAAESRASRAETALAEESAKLRGETSRMNSEIEAAQRRADAVETRAERALLEATQTNEQHVKSLNAQIRKLQNETESLVRSTETLRATHHANIMEIQERMTKEAEAFLSEERQHAESERDSLRRTLEAVSREAEESAARQEKSWLGERKYLRKELEEARAAAQSAQQGLQTTMLDQERYALQLDVIRGELRAEKLAHRETNAQMAEVKAALAAADGMKVEVQRMNGELQASSKTGAYAKKLESQLRNTERELQEALSLRAQAEMDLRSSRSQSRVHALQTSVARLKDQVEIDVQSVNEHNRGTVGNHAKATGITPGKSESGILEALSQDHRRALQANSAIRRELSMKQDELTAANKNLMNERQLSAQKLKSLTTILRQAQEGWTREREEILRDKRRSEASTREFESAARLHSRMSEDASKERDSAIKKLQENARLLQSKSNELEESRRSLMSIRDENLSLSRQSDLLRTEVLRISDSAKRRTQSLSRLDMGLELASDELSHSQRFSRTTPLSAGKLRMSGMRTPGNMLGREKGATSGGALNDRAEEAVRQLRRFGSPIV